MRGNSFLGIDSAAGGREGTGGGGTTGIRCDVTEVQAHSPLPVVRSTAAYCILLLARTQAIPSHPSAILGTSRPRHPHALPAPRLSSCPLLISFYSLLPLLHQFVPSHVCHIIIPPRLPKSNAGPECPGRLCQMCTRQPFRQTRG